MLNTNLLYIDQSGSIHHFCTIVITPMYVQMYMYVHTHLHTHTYTHTGGWLRAVHHLLHQLQRCNAVPATVADERETQPVPGPVSA